jgi:hypothetical protein
LLLGIVFLKVQTLQIKITGKNGGKSIKDKRITLYKKLKILRSLG